MQATIDPRCGISHRSREGTGLKYSPGSLFLSSLVYSRRCVSSVTIHLLMLHSGLQVFSR